MSARYGRRIKRQLAGLMLAGLAVVSVAGCAEEARPTTPAVQTTSADWSFNGVPGREVRSEHYRVRTTVRDPALVDRFVRVMETAYAGYVGLVAPAARETEPLEAYLFEKPEEWEAFTRQLTGRDAPVYLSVGPGGYAYGDRFVCWLFNENDLWGVAAHEGLHQYLFRHLPARLPPALEEGLATTWEDVTVSSQQVRIDRQSNARRQAGLATAKLIPVSELITMHAGDIAGQPMAVREAFYGQCWALARVLCDSPDFAPRLHAMLTDLRDGKSEGVGQTSLAGLYHPAAGRRLLERYLVADWSAFEKTYASEARQLRSTNDRRD